jgi:NADP-dependent 3-hydroxy acid dehydrogenase YdfG
VTAGDLIMVHGIQDKVVAIAMSAESFARTVRFAMSQQADIDINEILYWPVMQEL